MKTILILTLTILLMTNSIDAQKTADSVKAVVKQLFDGMKNSDAASIRSAFADSASCKRLEETPKERSGFRMKI